MASEVDIYNMALDLLDEEVAVDVEDDRAPVRWMRRNFAPVRDAILRRNPWNFAIKRVVLPALVTPPAFGWKYRYQLPSDCLRPLPLESCGEFEGRPIRFKVEGREILANETPPLRLRYISRVDDTTLFDPLFTQLLAAELAMRAANWISGKQSYAERLTEVVRQLNTQATLTDFVEDTTERPYDSSWIASRYF